MKTHLKLLFPAVHESVIIHYANYLATKDRHKFRLELFERELTNYDYLIESNLSDLAKPVYVEF